MPDAEQNKKILEMAADVRKFEIGLFWQRSLFFWGFIEQIECKVLDYRLFGKEGKVQQKNWWLQARRYSVSKLTIALSDFTIAIWLLLMAKATPWNIPAGAKNLSFLIPVAAICYAGLMLCAGRSTPRSGESCPPQSN
jgi:hypothetical protein